MILSKPALASVQQRIHSVARIFDLSCWGLVIVCAVCLPALAIRFYQAWAFDAMHGYDGSEHVKYILYLYQQRAFPPVDLSLETYQPPLYYILGMVFVPFEKMGDRMALAALKMFSTLIGLMIAAVGYGTYLTIRNIFGGSRRPYIYGLIFLLYLPMHLYMNCMVTNELLSALLISLVLMTVMNSIHRNDYSVKTAVLLGALISAALLTKYTGLLMLMTAVISYAIMAMYGQYDVWAIAKFLLIMVTVVAVGAGWWYARNAVRYGDPLIKANDLEKYETLLRRQQPGKHTAGDFFTFDTRVFSEPMITLSGNTRRYNTVYNNVLTGTFATMWVENHLLYLAPSPATFRYAGRLLAVGLVICGMIILGFAGLVRNAVRSGSRAVIPLMVLVVVSGAAYVWHNVQYPYFYHVKAFFLLHLSVPLMLAYSYSAQWLVNRKRWGMVIYYILVAAQIMLVTMLYTIGARY